MRFIASAFIFIFVLTCGNYQVFADNHDANGTAVIEGQDKQAEAAEEADEAREAEDMAGDEAKAQAEAEVKAGEEKAAPSFSNNIYLDALNNKTALIVNGLGEDDLEALYHIRESFGITRSVSVVFDMVSKTASICSEENPGIKERMAGRLEEWQGAVKAVLDESEEKIQLAIDNQKFIDPAEIRDYLRLIKAAADFTNSQIEKIPVTTEEACKGLLASMDDTEENLLRIMKELQIPDDIVNPSRDEEEASQENKDSEVPR
jgi:hypothetical protein